MGLFDASTQPGEDPKAFLHLPQLVQVAVLPPALQGQLLLLSVGEVRAYYNITNTRVVQLTLKYKKPWWE